VANYCFGLFDDLFLNYANCRALSVRQLSFFFAILLPTGSYVFTRVCLSVCLSVCLLTGLLTKSADETFTKLYGMIGRNPGTNRVDCERS